MVRYCVTIQCQYWHLLEILFENGITPSPRISNNRWSPGTFPECLICIISWDCQALTKYLGNTENVIKGWLCLKYKTVQPSNLRVGCGLTFSPIDCIGYSVSKMVLKFALLTKTFKYCFGLKYSILVTDFVQDNL